MALEYEKKNGIAYITLNRPEAHNAVDPQTVIDLIEAWKDYSDDKAARCAIITGKGDKTFCSGADLGKLIPLFTGTVTPETEAEKQIQQNPLLAQRALLRDFKLNKPLIAAVNGSAIAGGLELLYSTDIRVAAQGSMFGLQEVKWAIFPMGGSSVKLPRQLPYAKAMEMLLTGDLIDADEAYRYGLINKVVPAANVMEEAEKYAYKIAANGPMAVEAIKTSVLTNIGLTIEKGLEKELEYAIPVFMSEDAKEGPQAFKERREPKFIGK